MRFNSLRSRILLLTTIPLTVLLAVFLLSTLRTVDSAVRSSIDRSLEDAGSVFVKLLETRQSELLTMALVTGRDPRFFATFTIPESDRTEEFGPTVRGVAEDFLRITDVDFMEIFDAQGQRITLAALDVPERTQPQGPMPRSVQFALEGRPVTNVARMREHLVVTAVVPVFVANRIRGVLRIGNRFDDEFVQEVERLTGADVALMAAEAIVATSFPTNGATTAADWPAAPYGSSAVASETYRSSGAFPVRLADVDYRAIEVQIPSLDTDEAFHAYLGRELSIELQPIVSLSRKLALAGVAGLVITLAMAWAVAQRINRPLAAVVAAAHAMQRGDYDQPLMQTGADEVAFLARSFDEMRRDLASNMTRMRNLDQMKSNFISLAGHELRTPLTVITAFNEMILNGEMGKIPETMQEATQSIQERLTDLNRKVTNILEISQFEQGISVLQRQPVEVTQLVEGLVQERRALLQQRSLEIDVEAPDRPLWVEADRDYLLHALQQLLDNAIRFTDDDGRVRIELRQIGENVQIAVRDTGIGIEPEQQRWIFEKAWETSDLMHHTSGHLEFGSRGLGLGLALARNIVQAHNGEITLESQPGHGSCFTIILAAVDQEVESTEEVLATA